MTDLQLNSGGIQCLRNQLRMTAFINAYSGQNDILINIDDDNYLGEILYTSKFIESIVSKLNIPSQVEQVSEEWFNNKFSEVTNEQIVSFNNNVQLIQQYCQNLDSNLPKVKLNDYFGFLETFLHYVIILTKMEDFPHIDFNSDEFIDYKPSEADIKLLINLQGTSVLEVQDINHNLLKEPKFYSNNLWAMYITLIIGCMGLQLSNLNLPYFLQQYGATATQVANLTTYFNLTQCFSSLFWLYVSDFIGRKPVFMAILAIYCICCATILAALNFKENQQVINFVLTLRACMGFAAILNPLTFLIASDLAPPKLRGIVIVLINCFSQIGSVLANCFTVFFSNYKIYNTSAANLEQSVILLRVNLSFRDTHILSVCLFIISFTFCLIFMKESNQKLLTSRKLKKLGLKIDKNMNQLKSEPIYKVAFSMVKDPNMMILFSCFVLSLLGSTNSRTGGAFFIGRMYGFTNSNQAKGYTNIAQIVSISLGLIVSAFMAKPFIRKFGELRAIILAQYFSIFESLVYFVPNPPQPKELMYLTLFLTGISLIFCDAIFLQLVTMYTVPQNRGSVMGIFQIGNSIGRSLSGLVTGAMQEYNIREAQLFNTFFQSGCIILLIFLKPPIQRTQMDAVGKKNKENELKEAMI